MTTTERKEQLEALRKRRSDLQIEVEAARIDLKAAQSDQIDGVEGAGERVTTLQAQISGTLGSIEALDERIERAEEALRRAEEADKVEAGKERMVRLAREAAEARDAHNEALRTLAIAVNKAVDAIAESREVRRQAIRRFLYEADPILEAGADGSDLADDLACRGVDLTAVMSDAVVQRDQNFSGRRLQEEAVDVPYGVPIHEMIRKVSILKRIEEERGRMNGASVAQVQQASA